MLQIKTASEADRFPYKTVSRPLMSGMPSSLVRDGKRNNCTLRTSAADRPVACLSFTGDRSGDEGQSVDGFPFEGDRRMLNRIVQNWDSLVGREQ